MFLSEDLKNQIIEMLSVFPQVKKVILFGSRARGDHDERSDIDLAISAPSVDERLFTEITDRLEDLDTLLEVDVVKLDHASEDLVNRIRKEGIVLYERL